MLADRIRRYKGRQPAALAAWGVVRRGSAALGEPLGPGGEPNARTLPTIRPSRTYGVSAGGARRFFRSWAASDARDVPASAISVTDTFVAMRSLLIGLALGVWLVFPGSPQRCGSAGGWAGEWEGHFPTQAASFRSFSLR